MGLMSATNRPAADLSFDDAATLRGLRDDEAQLVRYTEHLATIRSGGKVENLTEAGAKGVIAGLTACIANKRAFLARAVA